MTGRSGATIGTKGYKYKDPNGDNAGLTKLLLKRSLTAGKSKVLVKGKGASLPAPPLDSMPLPVTVQVINGDAIVGPVGMGEFHKLGDVFSSCSHEHGPGYVTVISRSCT